MERKIIIGLIISTQYLQKIKPYWNIQLIQSGAAKRIAAWCWKYFEKYNVAPGKNIEDILLQKMKNGLPEELAEEIEEDILPGLSEQLENEKEFNVDYLFEESKQYFKQQQLSLLSDNIKGLLEKGDIEEARKLVLNYSEPEEEENHVIDLADKKIINDIDQAFDDSNISVLHYPGALGQVLNSQLIHGAFIAFLATEKRGKTWFLIDMALRARRQGKNVAFFQAGDMTKNQQLRRICIYLAKKSDKEKYTGEIYEPVKDCIFSQMGTCTKSCRESEFGIFDEFDENYIRKEITKKDLIEALEDEEYKPCHNCIDFQKNEWGVPYLKKINIGNSPLEKLEAEKLINTFFIENNRHFKLVTYSNGTLTTKEVRRQLRLWKKNEGFEPELILTDYADLFEANEKEFRHKQNEIWKDHRAISQENNQPLVITVTQADGAAYDQDTLKLKNYSEDKRKYAHVTAFYGLNQDHKGREKEIGIMRINELVIREDEFDVLRQVKILQNLKRGRPFLTSYF